MAKNPILDELREIREKLLVEAGNTLAGLVEQLQRDERCSDREFVCPKKRANQYTKADKPDVSAAIPARATGTVSDPVVGVSCSSDCPVLDWNVEPKS
jgi:hypothetical protein